MANTTLQKQIRDREYIDLCRSLPLRLYTIREIAIILRCSPQTIRAKYLHKTLKPNTRTLEGSRKRQNFFTDDDLIQLIDRMYPNQQRMRSYARKQLEKDRRKK